MLQNLSIVSPKRFRYKTGACAYFAAVLYVSPLTEALALALEKLVLTQDHITAGSEESTAHVSGVKAFCYQGQRCQVKMTTKISINLFFFFFSAQQQTKHERFLLKFKNS